jgi:DNA-binding GntR family transcriptional regulator
MLHAEFNSPVSSSFVPGSPGPAIKAGPIVKSSLVGGVYQHLLESILSGATAPGLELNEVALARHLQVSRTPVHEALRRLGADGLVEGLPNGKSRVIQFQRDSVIALYEMRKILEGAAAALSAPRVAAERLQALRAEAERLEAPPLDASWCSRAISFDLHFHDVVAESSGNEFLRKDILRHRRLVQGFCRYTGTPANLRAAFDEHLEVLGALEAGDAEAARLTMMAHIDARLKTLLVLLDQNAPSAAGEMAEAVSSPS